MNDAAIKAAPTTDTSRLVDGDIISYTPYYQYVREEGPYVFVKDQRGEEIRISKSIIEFETFNDRQYVEEVKLSRTELIRKLHDVGDTVFQVNFIKKNGDPRTMTCKMVSIENGFGRSNVIDMKLQFAGESDTVRQVDHRTLNWIILKNVKYSVK